MIKKLKQDVVTPKSTTFARIFKEIVSKSMNKISYALGLGIGQQLKNMGIEDFNVQDFTQSICDVLSGATPAIPHREAQAMLNLLELTSLVKER